MRPRLGAEELIELGQASSAIPSAASRSSVPRTVTITAEEGKLMIQVVENLITFSQDYPIEFHSYCPTDRWKAALSDVGTWVHEIERQLTAGATLVSVPAHAVFQMVDLEKCVSAARDARLTSAKWAFTLSAVGAIADIVLGITWLGIPAYIGGLALLLGRPLLSKVSAEPQDPYKPELAGRHRTGRRCLGGECQLIAMKLKKEAEQDSFRRQVLERVIVAPFPAEQRHHWGIVRPRPGPVEGAVFLAKDRFRVRVEGWLGDDVIPSGEWTPTTQEDCQGTINIAVYQAGRERTTQWGPLNTDSGHDHSYWVEYLGPLSQGVIRRAGPFGCTGDPVDHAMEDSGFTDPGTDGGYVIFDEAGNVADDGTGLVEAAA
jgi:hypothetical protein